MNLPTLVCLGLVLAYPVVYAAYSRSIAWPRPVAARRVPVQRLGELRPGAGGPAVLGRPQEHADLHAPSPSAARSCSRCDRAADQPDQHLDVAADALPDPAALRHPADRQRPDLGVPLQLPVRLPEPDPVQRRPDRRTGQLGRQSPYGALCRRGPVCLAHPALRHHPGARRPAGYSARALRAGCRSTAPTPGIASARSRCRCCARSSPSS